MNPYLHLSLDILRITSLKLGLHRELSGRRNSNWSCNGTHEVIVEKQPFERAVILHRVTMFLLKDTRRQTEQPKCWLWLKKKRAIVRKEQYSEWLSLITCFPELNFSGKHKACNFCASSSLTEGLSWVSVSSSAALGGAHLSHVKPYN